MDMMNRLLKLRPNLDKGDVSIQDNSDGNGPFIVEWNSAETQPTEVELDSVDDSPPAMNHWKLSMQETDHGMPRFAEDILDGMPDKSGVAKITLDRLQAKKDLRATKP